MAQKFLHASEVRPALKQVGGEAVTQGVRTDGTWRAAAQSHLLDDTVSLLARQASAALAQENRLFPMRRTKSPALLEVPVQPLCRRAGQRNETLLPALAQHPHQLLIKVYMGEIKPQGLADAQPGTVENFKQGQVAQSFGIGSYFGLDQMDGLIDIEDPGVDPRQLGIGKRRAWIFLHQLALAQKAVKRAQGGKLATDARFGETAPVQIGKVGGDVGLGHLARNIKTLAPAPEKRCAPSRSAPYAATVAGE